MNKNVERLYNGIIKESPIPSPLIADDVTAKVGHIPSIRTKVGFSTTVVLVLSNLLISAFRKVIPTGFLEA